MEQMSLNLSKVSTDESVSTSATIEIKELTVLLNKARYLYYMLNQEIMSNKKYDELFDRLQYLEDQYGIVYADSPTCNIGYSVVSKLEKTKHEVPLMSLNKTKETNQLLSMAQVYECLLSYKLDGLSLIAVYENGTLKTLGTRGDGSEGENVTHNARAVQGLPLRIPYTKKLYIIGEVLVGHSEFKQVNATLSADEQYSNSRNLAAGSIRKFESKIACRRGLSFHVFKVIAPCESFEKKSRALEWVRTFGFNIVRYEIVGMDILDKIKLLESEISNSNLPMDGLVLTVDDIDQAERMGATSSYPKDSISYKWQDQTFDTVMKNVVWQTGRTGVITPVAIFEPVNIDGKEVGRASLHNISQVEILRIGIGDRISIYMANTVIPQVDKNYSCTGTLVIPSICPECGGTAEIQKPKDAKILVCLSPDCPAKLVQRLKHFASREAMNIAGISESTFEILVNAELIRDLPDIYKLVTYEEEIIALPGFGKRSFENMIESIKISQNVDLWRFIYSLGIKHIGRTASKALCQYFENDLESIMAADYSILQKVDGFGPKLAESLYEHFLDENNKKLVQDLLVFVSFKKGGENIESKLSNKVFVITGKVGIFSNRNAVRAFIEQHGGVFGTSVTRSTDYLVTNDPYSGSSKNRKAKELGIRIITENDLVEMV